MCFRDKIIEIAQCYLLLVANTNHSYEMDFFNFKLHPESDCNYLKAIRQSLVKFQMSSCIFVHQKTEFLKMN